jgi:hypothetical protein
MAEKRNHIITVKPEGYQTRLGHKWKEKWYWRLDRKSSENYPPWRMDAGYCKTKEEAIDKACKVSNAIWEQELRKKDEEARAVIIEL